MSTYAIGDLQGCYRPFLKLLEALEFDPSNDQLWLVGDLVNRGPESLQCLRYVRGLGSAAITVLGNHDLSLLALAEKPDGLTRANPTLKPILQAPDRDDLLTWLRQQPLIHHDATLKWTMVHAGLAPDWDIPSAIRYAGEVESALRDKTYRDFLANMYGNEPDAWSPELNGMARLRVITNYFTRARLCQRDGRLDMHHKGTLKDAPSHLTPWFALPKRASANERIVFGHWSALDEVCWPQYNVWGIDTGCVWGRRLTALKLDSKTPKQISIGCA